VRELSLHILDLMENSLRAEATIVAVTVEVQPESNVLKITIEDNGPGLAVTAEQATDPFYTTKEGKRTGLGLSLFRATAQLAGGGLTLERSELGGLAVRAEMKLDHIDRLPMGDLASTFFTLACTNPLVDFWCRLIFGKADELLKLSEMAEGPASGRPNALSTARKFSEKIQKTLSPFDI
jgi:signal transduction histidine kinase